MCSGLNANFMAAFIGLRIGIVHMPAVQMGVVFLLLLLLLLNLTATVHLAALAIQARGMFV